MRNSKLSNIGIVVIASSLMLILPGRSWAQELGKNVIEESSQSDLDTGRFSRFPVRVSVSLRGGYDDNVNTTTFNEQGSAFVSIGGTLAYNFGSPRTQLSLTTGGGFTYYLDDIRGVNNDNYDANIYLSLSATHKVNSRLTLAASVYASYQTQPDFSLNVALNRQSGSFFYTSDKFSLSYLWTPRFSTVTSYSLGVVNYNNSSIGAFEDRVENTLGNEFRFLVLPTTSLIAEYRVGFISYDTGTIRDSISHYVLGGIDHSFSPRFNISLRGGAEFRDFDNNGESTDPYFEGTLIYALSKWTSISWTNRYGLEEPDVPGSISRTTFRTGLSVRHYFTARISTNLAFFYQHDNNDGFESFFVRSPAFTEDSFDLVLSARYAITRNFALETGYNFTDVESDIALRSYTRNRFWGGVNFSF
jgi:Putative beta-barrel porin 2